MQKKIYIHFSSALIFSLIITTLIAGPAYSEMLSVASDGVNLRSEPSTKSKIKWEYGKGFPLKVVSKKGDWVQVQDFENDKGWIFKSLLNKKGNMIVKVNKKNNKKVNIRSKPTTKSKIVGKAYYGVVFETLEQKDGWARVKHETGLTGWIKRSLLWGF